MAGLEILNPQGIYNILQDFDFHKFYRTGNFILLLGKYFCLQCYLVLYYSIFNTKFESNCLHLDARIRQEYDESHVVTAIFAPRVCF